MKQIDKWVREKVFFLEQKISGGAFDTVYLFTNPESRAINSESSRFFQAYGEVDDFICDIAVMDVFGRKCDCEECVDLAGELDELISIKAGLNWIRENFENIRIELWVWSEEFFKGADRNFQGFSVTCLFQRILVDDIAELLKTMDVQVDEYTYANKDVIPVAVTGKTLTGRVEV